MVYGFDVELGYITNLAKYHSPLSWLANYYVISEYMCRFSLPYIVKKKCQIHFILIFESVGSLVRQGEQVRVY